MSAYQKLASIGARLFGLATLFRVGFNLSPMFRRTTGRITFVSDDLHEVRLKIPISYRNRNYLGTMFGGSMYSALDGVPIVQLINILKNQYVVWDKSGEIRYRAPAREDLYSSSVFSGEEIGRIESEVARHGETEIVKTLKLTNRDGTRVFAEVSKTLYIASKQHHRDKQRRREAAPGSA